MKTLIVFAIVLTAAVGGWADHRNEQASLARSRQQKAELAVKDFRRTVPEQFFDFSNGFGLDTADEALYFAALNRDPLATYADYDYGFPAALWRSTERSADATPLAAVVKDKVAKCSYVVVVGKVNPTETGPPKYEIRFVVYSVPDKKASPRCVDETGKVTVFIHVDDVNDPGKWVDDPDQTDGAKIRQAAYLALRNNI